MYDSYSLIPIYQHSCVKAVLEKTSIEDRKLVHVHVYHHFV